MDSNKVKYIEELYKWHNKKTKNCCYPNFNSKNTWSTEFLKTQPKDTENKRELLHAEQVWAVLCFQDK